MHLWPSLKLRDSFKKSYLDRLEWNLYRMKIDKNSQQNSKQQRLLDDDGNNRNQEDGFAHEKVAEEVPGSKTSSFSRKAALLCREIIFALSCCYCCFCCGACVEDVD